MLYVEELRPDSQQLRNLTHNSFQKKSGAPPQDNIGTRETNSLCVLLCDLPH